MNRRMFLKTSAATSALAKTAAKTPVRIIVFPCLRSRVSSVVSEPAT